MPGSSEIIESIFGNQKQLEKQQLKSGFPKLILAIAARISKTTMPIVKKAMRQFQQKNLMSGQKNIKKNCSSTKKENDKYYKKMEQKWN